MKRLDNRLFIIGLSFVTTSAFALYPQLAIEDGSYVQLSSAESTCEDATDRCINDPEIQGVDFDLNLASKTKLIRLSNGGSTHGRLVSVYGDGWASSTFPEGHTVYDVKAQAERQAKDIFARYSDDNGETWSDPVNIANTAQYSSATTQWRGEYYDASPFYGDSDKPNIFNTGNFVSVSWVDKYCDSGAQGSVTYIERDFRQIPFSCTYIARSKDGGKTWMPAERLSDGSRDAKQDVNKGNSKAWIVTWQEDPTGLELGDADGPGDGASGATTSHGSDIWYSYVKTSYNEDAGETAADSDYAQGVAFTTPVRITNNWTSMSRKRNDSTTTAESGQQGAARANLGLMGPTVVLAYEETKGSEGIDEGKYIRYHSFNFAAPPSTLPNACLTAINGTPTDCDADALLPPNPALPERAGCILSNPEQNGRRVRFFAQAANSADPEGTKLFIFWKQGEYSAGGPSDIVGRYASDFTDLSSFTPALNVPTDGALDGCLVRGEDVAEYTDPDTGDLIRTEASGAFVNTPGLNLSADTELGGDLTAHTDDNAYEDARAHRGFMRGNLIVLGYSYTPDGIVARDTDLDHYNFWIRRSVDGGATWEEGRNMTAELLNAYIEAHPEYILTQIDVKEPRIVKTPGNGPATCPTGDPEDETTTDPSECSNSKGFIVAGGLVENTYEHIGGGAELDLFITHSIDGGVNYSDPIYFAATDEEEFESQIRMTPALDSIFAAWNSSSDEYGKNANFVRIAATVVEDQSTNDFILEEVVEEEVVEEAETEEINRDTGFWGGSVSLWMLLAMSAMTILRRRRS